MNVALKIAQSEVGSDHWKQEGIDDTGYRPVALESLISYRSVFPNARFIGSVPPDCYADRYKRTGDKKRWVYEMPFNFKYVGREKRFTEPFGVNVWVDVETGNVIGGE